MSNFKMFRKLWTSVYPPNKAIQHLRLCTRPIQTLTNVWFFEKTKLVIAKFSDRKVSFLQFLLGFGGARAQRTWKSASASFFSLDTPILRSEKVQNTSETHPKRTKHVQNTYKRMYFNRISSIFKALYSIYYIIFDSIRLNLIQHLAWQAVTQTVFT